MDHFVPWSRYPVDLGHNFVLAHATCNQDKSNRLAACDHLDRWCRRNAELGEQLSAAFTRSGLVHDLEASRRVARWAYAQTAASDGHVWVEKSLLIALDPSWRGLPGMAA